MARIVRSNVSRVAAIAIVLVVYFLARLPSVSTAERAQLAGRFKFAEFPLAELPGEAREVRPVHRTLEHISAWISSVGGSVALNDLDGDGLANDVCYVDTRTDQVVIAPVPGSKSGSTADRFAAFKLDTEAWLDRRTMCPTGCLPGDFNEDGLKDVLVYCWGRPPVVFLRRAGTEKEPLSAVSYAAVDLVTTGERWFTNAATQADVDGDGHVDLVIGNYFPDDAHILDPTADGVEQMHDSMSKAFNGGRKRLLLWTAATAGDAPTVAFRDVDDVFENDVAHGWTLAIGAGDLDGDMLPELYFGHDFGPDRLLHNLSKPGQPKFALLEGVRTMTTPKSKVLGHDSFKGMGVDFGDIDGDGLLDIYVSNIAGEYSLEESHLAFINTGRTEQMAQGIAPFDDRSEDLGLSRSSWSWDARLADLDNDGTLEVLQATGFLRGTANRWPELHEVGMGNDKLLHVASCWHRFQPGDELSGNYHNAFFVKAGDGRYYDVAPEIGLGETRITRGIATADVDGDGDLDYAMGNQWETSYFYRNDIRSPGAFLALRLLVPLGAGDAQTTEIHDGHLSVPNTRDAIGAVARVHVAEGRQFIGLVDGGNGHSGKRSGDLHFGLGKVSADASLKVDVHWRAATGRVEKTTLSLSPGWHTVVLAGSSSAEQEPVR